MSGPSDSTASLGPVVIAADERDPADSPGVTIDIDRWRDLATAVLVDDGAAGELTLTFVDAVEIAELNEAHMGKDGPTDVLSFPLDDDDDDDVVDGVPVLLGDVVISPAVADAQYAGHAGTLDDELALLVVHGILHVRGHDHAEPDEAAHMRSRELELLERHHWRGTAPAAFRQTHD
jgi:probable rRNA maturation factor